MDAVYEVRQGNVFDVLPTIPAGSVDAVCTSPPYWMLRSYLANGHALKRLELGQEKTPQEYVANMVRVLDLIRPALADHGTVWLNIGDTYTHHRGKRKPGDKHGPKQCTSPGSVSMPSATAPGTHEGNLCLIPWRLAIAAQDAGWIVRSVIAWQKPAPMPVSVRGWRWERCRVLVEASKRGSGKKAFSSNGKPHGARDGKLFASSAKWLDCPGCPGCPKCAPHGGYVLRRGSWRPTSSWEPILMLAKSARYFCDGEAVRQPPASATVSRDQYTRIVDDPGEQFAVRHDHETLCSGANLRDVWRISAENLKEKHYAAFPTALAERCLKSATSEKGYCRACGMPWVRVVKITGGSGRSWHDHQNDAHLGMRVDCRADTHNPDYRRDTLGWRPSCSCPPGEPRPAVVLDPFCGSGRTGKACVRLGLDFLGIELNPEYVAMAEAQIDAARAERANGSLAKDHTLPGPGLALFADLTD